MVLEPVRRVVGRWVGLDAAVGRRPATPAVSHPTLGGSRLTDASATLGMALWVALGAAAVTDALALTTVDLFVALAVLVLVPLGLGLAATPREDGRIHPLYRLPVVAQPAAALCVVGSLALPVGSLRSVALALPWLAVTGSLALFGLWRLLSRGLGPVPELAVDAALFYLPVGAVALLLHRGAVALPFDPIIVLLTVVHYHYAGFVLPLVTGFAGRRLTDETGRFPRDPSGYVGLAATLTIVVNLALIAVGITFSPTVEVIAVGFFTVAVAAFALLVFGRVVPHLPRVPAALLGVATLSIVGTMALALAYGYSAFPATGELIGISRMIRWHGSLNAFGFALPALLAFRLLGD